MRKRIIIPRSSVPLLVFLTFVSLSSPVSAQSTEPVLWYDMETLTADGRMNDLSGNCNNGDVNGASDIDGYFGRARSFNGTTDYIGVENEASFDFTGNFTVMAWVFVDTNIGVTTILNKFSTVDANWGIFLSAPNQLIAAVYDNTGTEVDAISTIINNDWTHVALVHEGNTLRLYRDGISVASATANPPLKTNDLRFNIGRQRESDSRFFDGIIDEIYVFGSPLSASQIVSIANEDTKFQRNPCLSGITFPDADVTLLLWVLVFAMVFLTAIGFLFDAFGWFCFIFAGIAGMVLGVEVGNVTGSTMAFGLTEAIGIFLIIIGAYDALR